MRKAGRRGSTKATRASKSRTSASTAAKKSARRKTARPKTAVASRSASTAARSRQSAKRGGVARSTSAKAAAKSRQSAERGGGRKAPALDRERRTIQGDDIVPTPPSSLDLDRNASAARTGRQAMREKLNEHTETSPSLTAGDVDADWESAYSVGDEAPGGDNPTPDQDVVDDIGRAVGVQYDDNEELKGDAKIAKRDKHRWELDPASSEDYDDR
jgi:hypothetical protein